MPQPKKGARVLKWRGEWHLFYLDHIEGRQRRIQCKRLDAHNAAQRRELVREYDTREATESAEARQRGGVLAYNTPLKHGIDAFRKLLDERVRTRRANPASREGLSPRSAVELLATVDLLDNWLDVKKKGLTTGNLDGPTLQAFFGHLAARPTVLGTKKIRRSNATLNKHRRNIRALLNFLNEQRPPRFPDFDIFKKALRPLRSEMQPPVAFKPGELVAFLKAALDSEGAGYAAEVTRLRQHGRTEQYKQRPSHRAATPVSRLFLMLALTGRRLQDALTLEWKDVDLEKGRITFRSQKTGSIRILPLVGAPEGEVAPGLLALLRRWRKADPDARFVLPHTGLAAPQFPKGAWQRVNKLAKVRRIGPQLLRENFSSYAVSLGFPPAVAAMWAGHSKEIQERHYRAQVLERVAGASIEQAMGL